MSNIFKTRKIGFFIVFITIFIFAVILIPKVFAMQSYYKLDFQTGLVTATNLYVRNGPGTSYKNVTSIPKNTYIRVFAGIGDWYVVQVEGDYIGAVSRKYVKPIYPGISNQGTSKPPCSSNAILVCLILEQAQVQIQVEIQQQPLQE